MKSKNQGTQDLNLIHLNSRIDDPNLSRKNELTSHVQFFDGVPLPSVIEISESGTCNRSCSFCPRSAPNFPDIKTFINQAFVKKIGAQLSTWNYQGLILFSGFVEPLLDKKIANHIAELKSSAPNAQIELVTNGDPVTVSTLNKLANAGLDKMLVSCYDGEWQLGDIGALVSQSKFSIEDVVFRKRWLPEEENFGISLSNRGGMMKNAEFSLSELQDPMKAPCFYPSHTLFIDYNGDVLLCAHDWGKKAIAGNIHKETIHQIWTGKNFSMSRKALSAGKRSFSPCNICNVKGTRTGRAHAEAWGDCNNV
jgi:radical SAM protein with 4Fe4S-binding SPASM domain